MNRSLIWVDLMLSVGVMCEASHYQMAWLFFPGFIIFLTSAAILYILRQD